MFGKTITIVNRSEIVGRPLAALLANDGANVYSVDITGVQHYTRGVGIKMKQHQVHDTDLKLEDVAPKSDVIITGVPTKNYKFPLELVKEWVGISPSGITLYTDIVFSVARFASISRQKRQV